MVDAIAVPSDTLSNAPNHKTFFDEIQSNNRRISELERGSIRSGSVGGAGLRFYDPDENNVTVAQIGEFDSYHWVQSSQTWNTVKDARGIALTETTQSTPWFVAAQDGTTQWFQVGLGGTTVETILLYGNDIWISGSSSVNTHINLNDAGDIKIQPLAGRNLELWNLPTTSNPASLRLETSSGTPIVQWVTSARKYKTDIQDAEVSPSDVLKLRGRSWVDKHALDADPTYDRRSVGFIADELDELPTLKQFVEYDDNGDPQSIYYDRLSVALLELLKEQQSQIDQQQIQIDEILARLNS